MRKLFIIVSVSDRVEQLNNLVDSIIENKFDDYGIALYLQDPENRAGEIRNGWRYSYIFTTDKKEGCHAARVHLLRRVKADVYINLDDDMLLTRYTRYDGAIAKAFERGTGFVLTNWARTEKQMLDKVPKMREKFIPQIMCYQGGGMVYTDKIAELMRGLPAEPFRYDDLWSLTSYINGYTNYAYKGSLAIHMVCTKGGMKTWMAEAEPPYACARFINYRKIKNGVYAIGLDSDVNEYARELHKKNLKK